MKQDMTHLYTLSRPPSRRPPMPRVDRAAQFAPFAALTGHKEAVAEAARPTESSPKLSEEALDLLDYALQELLLRAEEHPQITATCFFPDERKQGGSYRTITGRVASTDMEEGTLTLTDGTTLSLAMLTRLETDPLSENV